MNKNLGLRSHISGSIENLDVKEKIDRKLYRFMGDAAAYAYLSAKEAIDNANLTDEFLTSLRTGIIMGSGGASSEDQIESADILRNKGLKRIGPYRVTKAMGSTVSACLATSFGIKDHFIAVEKPAPPLPVRLEDNNEFMISFLSVLINFSKCSLN